ncbi:hypothetical protein C0J52_08886 [Blattella germanica]|nr:hypothetical protein C0J52_08886 [Blattella germanica]
MFKRYQQSSIYAKERMHIPNGTKYKEDEDLTAEKKLSAQAKATEQKLAYISCWISLIIIISKIIYTNRARIYKLTSSVGSFISDGKFGSRESLEKASELMVLAGSTLTEILYESRWILFPVLAGVGMTVLTWYTIYIDSCIPGVKPPTPFSPNRNRLYSSTPRFHMGYIVAIANGLLVFLITFFSWS